MRGIAVAAALVCAFASSAAAGAAGWSTPVGTNQVASSPVAGGGYPVAPGSTKPLPGTCGPQSLNSNHSESWIAAKPGTENLVGVSKFFVGKWKCEGKAFPSPMSPTEHAIKGTAEAKLVVDNFWQQFIYEEKKTKEHPGLKVNGYWGYDQGAKRFVRAAVGNMGEWDTASAPGWEGDKLVWTGELSGPMGRIPFHHTFTKKGEKEWMALLEARLPDGKWAPIEDVTCKK